MEECDKAYMKKGSDAHKALTKIALDKRFLGHVHYYLNFRYVLYTTHKFENLLISCRNMSRMHINQWTNNQSWTNTVNFLVYIYDPCVSHGNK